MKLFFSTLVLIGCALFSTGYADSKDWQKLAINDLHAIHDQLVTNAPQPLDSKAKLFHQWIDRGLELSLQRVSQINSALEYEYLLRYYVAGFQDAHLHLRDFKNIPKSDFYQWPGFTLYYSGQHFYTMYSIDKNIPNGAQLISCDDKSLKQIYKENILPYVQFPYVTPAAYYNYASSLLLDQGNPWIKFPNYCLFRINGKTVSHKLNYQKINKSELQTWQQVGNSYRLTFSTQSFGKMGAWISIPSFELPYAQNTPESQKHGVDFQETINELVKYKNANPLIIDLRGNGGGSDHFGKTILQTLYSKDYLLQNLHSTDSSDQLRLTPDNVAYINKYFTDEIEKAAINKAYNEKLTWYVSKNEASKSPENIPKITAPKNKIFILVDSKCVSACLDFLDGALQLPNVILIGQPTNADTIYMEARYVTLPSSNILQFQMQIDHRDRPSYAYYEPCYLYPNNIRDTAKVQDWILSIWQKAKHCQKLKLPKDIPS